MKKLRTDYLDLCLLHQPYADYYGAWRALEELYEEGKIRAIGVSNFYPDRLVDICAFARIKPMVNQVEVHPFHQQTEAKKWMDKYGVQIEAWAPFGEGRGDMFQNSVLNEIGAKVRQECGAGHSPLAFAEGRGGNPEIHPYREDAGKSECI